MLSRLRTHFGTAGLVVALVALVAALAGGAYAASSSGGSGKATASAKGKQGPRGKTGKTGPAGPAGPAGPQGPAGAAGKDGANGSNGTNGAAGPTGATGKQGNAGTPGGTGEVGPTGPTGDAGETGATGPTGTFGGINLQPGVTETGYWAFRTHGAQTIKFEAEEEEKEFTVGDSEAFAPISFPARLGNATGFTPRFQLTDPNFATTCGTGEGGAGGTPANPKAPPETLCIYVIGGAAGLKNATYSKTVPSVVNEAELLSNTGAIIKFNAIAEEPASGAGSWALTQ
jgi:collagen triple helix repeat protein